MAITVAELLVEIGVDARSAEKAADGLTKKLKKTEGAAGGAAKGVEKTTKEIDKLGKTSEVAGKLAGGLATVIKGVGVGIAALGTATLTTGATFEKLRAQLKTATGSAEGAEEALGFVREFAKNTPFQVEEITGAFIKLTNLGLTPSEEALTAYGDTASAMGKELDQLIEAVADATTGEFERLKEFGIKAKSEGDNVSFTFRGVTKTVGKNSAEIEKYLIDLSKNNFAGAMAEQMGTLNGIISNAKDAIATFFLTVAEMGPLEEFKLLISDIRDAAGGDSKGLAKILADTLTSAIRAVRRLMQGDFLGTLESIASAFKFLVENVDKLIALFAGAKMAQAFAAMATGFSSMGIAAAGALGPIGLIAGALIALIPLAIDVGDAVGGALAGASGNNDTKKRGKTKFLSDRFADPKTAAAAAKIEKDISTREALIATNQAGPGAFRFNKSNMNQRRQILASRAELKKLEGSTANREAFKTRASDAARANFEDRELLEFNRAEKKKTPRGKGRAKAKAKPKSATTLAEVLAADPAQLESMAASTPSTKAIEPTVAVDITNNNYSFDIDQIIRSNAEPGEVAREAALAIKKEFQTRLAAAGQQLQPNLVR